MTYILMNRNAAKKTANNKFLAHLIALRHGWTVHRSNVRL